MNTTCKCKIKTMVYKMSFIKALFKDEISKGLPQLWEGDGDLYKQSNLLNYDKKTTINFKTQNKWTTVILMEITITTNGKHL